MMKKEYQTTNLQTNEIRTILAEECLIVGANNEIKAYLIKHSHSNSTYEDKCQIWELHTDITNPSKLIESLTQSENRISRIIKYNRPKSGNSKDSKDDVYMSQSYYTLTHNPVYGWELGLYEPSTD